MQFEPKTEDELSVGMLLPDGVYDFEVVDAAERLSKKGNAMMVVNLMVYAQDGSTRYVRDYLMEAIAYKLRHFCAATGLLGAYNDGVLTSDMCAGRAGKVKIVTETQDGFAPRNAVKDYIVPDAGSVPSRPPAAPATAHTVHAEDEIPF
jgi:hypothetical protein